MNDSTSAPPPPARREDYEAIEAAVMETARGRWFLDEYARRRRTADTAIVLDAIGKLERLLRRERAIPDIDRIRTDLADMAGAIARTKKEIARLGRDSEAGGRIAAATEELDAILAQTETAASEILGAAEKIEDRVRDLREAGADDGVCDLLDETVSDVYAACASQDLTGRRLQKLVGVLQYLEGRIATMIDIWGIDDAEIGASDDAVAPGDGRPDAHLLNGPQLPGDAGHQDEADALFDGADAVEIVDFSETASDDAGPGAGAEAETVAADPRQSAHDFDRLAQDLVEALPEDEIYAVEIADAEDELDEAWREVETVSTGDDAGTAPAVEVAEMPAEAAEPAVVAESLPDDDVSAGDPDLGAIEPMASAETSAGETAPIADAPAHDIAAAEQIDAGEPEPPEAASDTGNDDPSRHLTAAERTALFS